MMTTGWRIAVVAAIVLACMALGMAVSAWLATDVEIAQGDPEVPIYIDLSTVMLKYDDPLRGMSGSITYRQVFEDALWYQINNPQQSEQTRVDAFAIVGMMHENRGTEITEAQYDILMDAVQQVWGPAILAILEDELQ